MTSVSELISRKIVIMTLLAIGWQAASERHYWRDYKEMRQLIMVDEGLITFWPDATNPQNIKRDLPITQDELLQLIQR